jgi:hypothetical protein
MYDYSRTLNAQKALIWRIVHRDNIPWILENGLHSGNSTVRTPDWIHIGNPELTDKRASHLVPVGEGGFLNDYVPFYFTPFSPMMKNIHSGWGGIKQRPNDEIVILVSSLHQVHSLGLPFVFTDGHAYYEWSNFYTGLDNLDKIDWPLLQARNFKRDPDDPGKFERYQAEALVHKYCPIQALLGMVCYTDTTKQLLDSWLQKHNVAMPVHARAKWYF